LLNAIYIDVFAASKVAQTYWALAGLFLGYLAVRDRFAKEAEQKAVYPATSTLAKEGVRHAKAKPKKKSRV